MSGPFGDYKVIGPGWSEDPEERARQIAEQERTVSLLARIEEKVSIFDLDDRLPRYTVGSKGDVIDQLERKSVDPSDLPAGWRDKTMGLK